MFRTSIRSKLLSLLLAATMLPMGCAAVVTYFFTTKSVTEKSIAGNTRILALGATNIDNYLAGVHQLAMSVYSGINLPNSLYTAILNTKPASPVEPSSGVTDNRDAIANQLYNMFQSNHDIYQIHLYVDANRQSNALLNGFFRRESNEAFLAAEPPPGEKHPVLEPVHPDHRYGLRSGIPNVKSGTTPVFSVHVPIYRAPSDEVMAHLSLDVRAAVLEALTKPMYDGRTEQLFLVNDQEEVWYASDPVYQGTRLAAAAGGAERAAPSGYYGWKDRDFAGIVFFQRLNNPLLHGVLVKRVRYEELYGDTRQITGINAGIGCLFLIVGAMAAVWISIRFTSPIKKLIAYTQKVQTGRLDARVPVRHEDEFGLLTRKITDMTNRIHHLIVSEYTLEIANKTYQLKALQAQINPHFLYNALQSIATTSLRYEAVQVYDLIYSLGSMMRYAMATEETEVTLEWELEHVRHYLLLQQERFGDELEVCLRVQEEAKPIRVPKMIVQPLVENAFKHGFDDSIRQGVVQLEVKLETAELLYIAVTDNGRGLTAERIAEIEAELAKKTAANDSIGLFNVLARLRLYAGSAAQLTMRANEPSGLTVAIWIPVTDTGEGANG